MYYTGKQCKRGHDGLRYISTKACVECQVLHSARSNIKRRKGNLFAMPNPEITVAARLLRMRFR